MAIRTTSRNVSDSKLNEWAIVKGVVRRNPGMTFEQLQKLCQISASDLVGATLGMNDNGILLIQDGKYYVLGPSSKERARRDRIRRQLCN